MANSATILSAATEDDFPSAALGPDGSLYVAYVAFTHGKDFRKRMQLPEPPEDWDVLADGMGKAMDNLPQDAQRPTTPGATSYYYVRGEQEDGELVWISPMWITYRP